MCVYILQGIREHLLSQRPPDNSDDGMDMGNGDDEDEDDCDCDSDWRFEFTSIICLDCLILISFST